MTDASAARNWILTGNTVWNQLQSDKVSFAWRCGYCGTQTSSVQGTDAGTAAIRVCGQCNGPTFIDAAGGTHPRATPGDPINHLPEDVKKLYDEARAAIGAGAGSAAVLPFRKIVMHVAVDKGAKAGESFLSYVEHLVATRHLPASADIWVDYIRQAGNDENHQITISSVAEATALLEFVSQLVKNVYELPKSVPISPTAKPEEPDVEILRPPPGTAGTGRRPPPGTARLT